MATYEQHEGQRKGSLIFKVDDGYEYTVNTKFESSKIGPKHQKLDGSEQQNISQHDS
jgi:hypothetical protein